MFEAHDYLRVGCSLNIVENIENSFAVLFYSLIFRVFGHNKWSQVLYHASLGFLISLTILRNSRNFLHAQAQYLWSNCCYIRHWRAFCDILFCWMKELYIFLMPIFINFLWILTVILQFLTYLVLVLLCDWE